MFARTSTPLNCRIPLRLKKKSIGIQTDGNKTKSVDDLLIQGKNMNDNEFEKFIKVHASDCYWKILAERARLNLEDQLRENRQLHEVLNELTKENEELKIKNEQSEYLTNIYNSILSEYDSGIELNLTGESPESKRQKKH